MPNQPILMLPTPVRVDPDPGHGGGNPFVKPSRAGQNAYFRDKLDRIAASFGGLQTDLFNTDPGQVVVFELVFEKLKPLMELARSADRIDGLEWLGEIDIEDGVRPGFERPGHPGEAVPLRLVAFFTTESAINFIIAEWDRWVANERRAAPGMGPLHRLFEHLTAVRR